MKHLWLYMCFLVFTIFSCSDESVTVESPNARLIIKFDFNETQERLGNLGEPSPVADGNAAQTPNFNGISAHYVELAPNQFTQLGEGAVIYSGEETTAGGANAVDFSQSIVVDEGETFLSIPISDIAAGSYEWMRVSLTYQNYDINLRVDDLDLTGTIASFVGYNTYINTVTVKDETVVVNDDKLQGFWAFEIDDSSLPVPIPVSQGDAARTTVPNPLASTSPIPAGSCVVTGEVQGGLTITGNETEDIVLTLSVSINNSFEWEDDNDNDLFEPLLDEKAVDMGLRGLKVFKE